MPAMLAIPTSSLIIGIKTLHHRRKVEGEGEREGESKILCLERWGISRGGQRGSGRKITVW